MGIKILAIAQATCFAFASAFRHVLQIVIHLAADNNHPSHCIRLIHYKGSNLDFALLMAKTKMWRKDSKAYMKLAALVNG